jgi:hypothetical protein
MPDYNWRNTFVVDFAPLLRALLSFLVDARCGEQTLDVAEVTRSIKSI